MEPSELLYQLNYHKPAIDQAYRVAENYIAAHKLLVAGGKAIDLALRQRGQSIYLDDVLKQFMILTDDCALHAEGLTHALYDNNLIDLDIFSLGAGGFQLHYRGTMIANVAMVPTEMLGKVPVIEIGSLRLAHPHYLLLDQRLSLSSLMSCVDQSLLIFRRLMKDVNRNLLLREHYPIVTAPVKMEMTRIAIPLERIEVSDADAHRVDEHCFVYTGKSCVAGVVAIMLYMGAPYELTSQSLVMDIPTGQCIRLLSCDRNQLHSRFQSPYPPMLWLKPACFREGQYEYLDTYGMRIGCYMMQLKSQTKNATVCVACADYLLMELLRDRIFETEEPYTTLYTQFVDLVDRKRSDTSSETIWWPALNTYGAVSLC